LVVAGITLRLAGIDAPEDGQRCRLDNGKIYDCGRISTTALMDLTAGVRVVCKVSVGKKGGLPLATCRAGGYDLSKGMVHTGWALAWPRTGTIYVAVEGAARKARHGLWRGKFDMPWDWRRGVRTIIESSDADY
jgi:endonuclease YncB( thermonuclease family)